MSKRAREMRKLKSWLGVPRKVSEPKPVEQTSEAIAEIFTSPEYKFEDGRDYEISESDKLSTHDIVNAATGRGCVFRYEGKVGIHHCFRETRGGWTRTYTDVQLIGKRIAEVK